MKRIFVELPIFQKRWKELGLNDEDLRKLQVELLADPKVGDVMQKLAVYEKCALLSNIEEKAEA